jgi:hypothetical protein
MAYLDVDIVLDESIDNTIVLQQEQFQQLAQLASSGVPIPPEAIIEASQLKNKKRVLELMKGGQDPAQQQMMAQQQAQMQAMAQAAAQLDLSQKAANIEKTQSETLKNSTDARVKAHEAAAASAMPAMQ